MRRGRVRVTVAVLVLGLLMLALQPDAPAGAGPQYPVKGVTMIVNFPPGGLADLSARALAEHAKPFFPRPIIVVNRPGGTGTVGASEVVLAKPDGYTIGVSPVAPMLVMPQRSDLPYKRPADFRPIVKAVKTVFVFAVHPDTPWKTLEDVLEAARATPGVIGVGVGGLGSIPHMVLESVKGQAGVDMSVVPFGGDPELTPALLGGHVKAAVILPLSVAGHVQANKVRVVGTFDHQRHPMFPNVPTFQERGLDVTLAAYTFAFGPSKMPEEAVHALHIAFRKAIQTPAFKKFADTNGLVIDYASPADLVKQIDGDWAFYDQLLRRLRLKR